MKWKLTFIVGKFGVQWHDNIYMYSNNNIHCTQINKQLHYNVITMIPFCFLRLCRNLQWYGDCVSRLRHPQHVQTLSLQVLPHSGWAPSILIAAAGKLPFLPSHAHAHLNTQTHTNTHTNTHKHTQMHTHTRTNTHTQTHTHARKHTHTHTHAVQQ